MSEMNDKVENMETPMGAHSIPTKTETVESKPAASGKIYKVATPPKFGDTDRKIDDTTIRVSTTDDWSPAADERLGWFSRKKTDATDVDRVVINNVSHEIQHKGTNKFLKKSEGWVALKDESDKLTGYARLMSVRKAAVALLAALALVIATIIGGLLLGIAPQNIPVIALDAIGITNNNKDAHANIEGTTSFQSPMYDQTTWVAGSKSQKFTMANPTGNTVALAPHIYVDFNNDGEFSDNECVYNNVTKDDKGNITSYGLFIEPGKQVEDITLTTSVDAGDYQARLEFIAVDIDTHTLCSGQNFDFTLSVR